MGDFKTAAVGLALKLGRVEGGLVALGCLVVASCDGIHTVSVV